MKKFLILFAIVFVISRAAKSQTTTVTRRVLDENTVVKDSSGTRYTYAVWTKMLQSGNYKLKKISPRSDTSSYIIVGQSQAERERLIHMMPKPEPSNFFTEGQTIESFSAHDMNGNKIKIKDLTGKVVVLNFWFIGCAPCRTEIPELNKLVTKYAGNTNVIFVAVALDYKSDIKNFLKDNPFGYQIIDNGRMFSNMYGINLYPTNVVLDKEGKVGFSASGFATNTPYWIENTIKQALEK